MSNRLVALPSLSSGLAHLPNATSVSGLSIHHPLSPSGYSQESEEKLRRAIASQNQPGRYSPASSVSSESSASNGGDYIMMGSKRR
ncbi:hypothetical protein FS837_009312 [Tulasnella sp. UAMH 9824]|nr:hypothetical protein FS837_009312 [Tulasnella sp. UAMH 9824]